jgi:hypothetical protein
MFRLARLGLNINKIFPQLLKLRKLNNIYVSSSFSSLKTTNNKNNEDQYSSNSITINLTTLKLTGTIFMGFSIDYLFLLLPLSGCCDIYSAVNSIIAGNLLLPFGIMYKLYKLNIPNRSEEKKLLDVYQINTLIGMNTFFPILSQISVGSVSIILITTLYGSIFLHNQCPNKIYDYKFFIALRRLCTNKTYGLGFSIALCIYVSTIGCFVLFKKKSNCTIFFE